MPLHNHFFAYNDDRPAQDSVPPTSPPSNSEQPSFTMVPAETDPLIPKSATDHSTQKETRTLIYACILTTFFFLVELIGGYIAGSLAIMSDAAHLLSDLAGFAISLLAVSVSRLPPNAQMSFGFARAEVLGAFVSILFIWALTLLLVAFAIERLFNPQPVDGPIMLALGIIGLVVNIILGFVLGHSHHGHSHAHSHDDSHDDSHVNHDVEEGHSSPNHDHHHDHDDHHHENHEAETKPSWRTIFFASDAASVNIRAAYLHVLGDALQNVGVIVAAIVMTIQPNWSFIDPICTLLFAIIVIMTTRSLAQETMTVLMEGTPPSVKTDDIYQKLMQINGVSRVGDLHVWSITARLPALSVHLYQQPEALGHDVVREAKQMLANAFGIHHATIQVNCETSDCCEDVFFERDSNKKSCLSYTVDTANGSTA